MLDAFKIKPFDLEPIFASWTDGPRFIGKPKKDPPVNEWLDQIKAGCVKRKVPDEYWYKVAQHFMGDKAKARFDELKTVMAKMHGGKYRWTWKKFKIAMCNMGWEIDSSAKETLKVRAKASGWWITRKKDEDTLQRPPPPPPSSLKSKDWVVVPKESKPVLPRRLLSRSMSVGGAMTTRDVPPLPVPARTATTDAVTTITQAPIWLLNATQALDVLVSEHPKVMSTLSAILITLGTIPAIPAISAGAGGAILASGTAHAVGAIAVGVGSWMKAHQDAKTTHPPS